MTQTFGQAVMGGLASRGGAGGAAAGGGAGSFRGHTTNKCPVEGCSKTLTAQDLELDSPEKKEYEREKKVRQFLSQIFNKGLDDFNGNRQEYDRYLETVELYIYNLVTETDLEATKAAIETYRMNHQSLIAFNEAKREAARREALEKVAAEQLDRAARAAKARQAEQDRKKTAERLRRQIMDVLLGEQKLGDAEKAALKAKLLEIKQQLQKGQQQQQQPGSSGGAAAGAAGEEEGDAAAADAASRLTMAVPCASVFPPAVLVKPGAALPAVQPLQLQGRQLLAAGALPSAAFAWLSEELAGQGW